MIDDLAVDIIKRSCIECGVEFEFASFIGKPDFGPKRCRAHQDAHAARQTEKNRLADAATEAEFSGIGRAYFRFDQSRDKNGYLDWIRKNRTKSLFLAGPTGAGKTHSVAFAGFKLILNYADRVWFIRMPEWLRQVSAFMGSNMMDAERLIHRAKKADLLIMDDLGKEAITGRVCEVVFDIIDWRESRQLRTWITTNASGQELQTRFGEDRGATILTRIKRSYVEFK